MAAGPPDKNRSAPSREPTLPEPDVLLTIKRGGWFQIEERGLPWRVEILTEQIGGRPQITGFRLEPLSPGRPECVITHQTVRNLPLRKWLQQELDLLAGDIKAAVGAAVNTDLHPSSAAHLHEVAKAYRYAVARGKPPRKFIADRWGRSAKTVDKWLLAARRADPPLLEAGTRGVAGRPV